MDIRDQIIEDSLRGYEKPEDFIRNQGLLKDLTNRFLEKALQGELACHLKCARLSSACKNTEHVRSRNTRKTIKAGFGEMEIVIPQDFSGTFEPTIIPRDQTCSDCLDEKVLLMYARGMSSREIRDLLKEIYQTKVSLEFISAVTDCITEDVRQWQTRPLDSIYSELYLDALMVKVKNQKHITRKPVYLAIGITIDGRKEVLDLWIDKRKCEKFWLLMVTRFKIRGVKEIHVAYVDGIKDLSEAFDVVFPKTDLRLFIKHMVWRSLMSTCAASDESIRQAAGKSTV